MQYKNIKYWILGGLLVLNIFMNLDPVDSKADGNIQSKGKIVYDNETTTGEEIVIDANDHTILKNNITANGTEILSLKEFVTQQETLNQQLLDTDTQLQENIDNLDSSLEQIKTSFQDGCNTIYNALVAKGVTPSDKSPASIAYAITNRLDKKNYSVTFLVSVAGNCTNGAGTVRSTAQCTYVLKDDGSLSNSGITKNSSAAVAYIGNCQIASLSISNMTYDETLDNITFTITTSLTASNGNGTGACNASQTFRITNKGTVTAVNSLSKSSNTVTSLGTPSIDSISISII